MITANHRKRPITAKIINSNSHSTLKWITYIVADQIANSSPRSIGRRNRYRKNMNRKNVAYASKNPSIINDQGLIQSKIIFFMIIEAYGNKISIKKKMNHPSDSGEVININNDGCHFVTNNNDLTQNFQFSGSTMKIHDKDGPSYFTGKYSSPKDLINDDEEKQSKRKYLCLIANLSIYSDRSDAAQRKTIDQIESESRALNAQDSNKQMTNCVSFVESLSRPFLNKHLPGKKKARCLGSWAYNGPGYDNEVIGKIEKDGIVTILNSTMNLIWHSIK